MNSTEEAREFFRNDIFASEVTGIEIVEARGGYAKCSLEVDNKHKNALGYVMGGVLFTMADYAFAVASNFDGVTTVTQTSQITYLSAVREGVVYAEAECIRSGKRSCFYKVTVSDEKENVIAYLTVTGCVIA